MSDARTCVSIVGRARIHYVPMIKADQKWSVSKQYSMSALSLIPQFSASLSRAASPQTSHLLPHPKNPPESPLPHKILHPVGKIISL